jgi:predicted AAA+ superfamily ATPase
MVKTEKIIEQNKWWVLGKDFAMHDKQLKDLNSAMIKIERRGLKLEKGRIYVIYGPRRIGKTTFIKKTILELLNTTTKEKIAYFSCDSLVTNSKEELAYVFDFLLKRAPEYLFIDEINVVKNWEQVVRFYFDQGKFSNTALVLTGSPFGIKEMLPGRNVEKYFMKPLNFRDFVKNLASNISTELLRALSEIGFSTDELRMLEKLKDVLEKTKFGAFNDLYKNAELLLPFLPLSEKLFDLYLHCGGFPSVINSFLEFKMYKNEKLEEEYTMIIDQLIDTLKKRGKKETIAKQIINAVAEKITSHYGFREITKATEEKTNQVTVIDYLHHLQDVFFLKIFYAYDFNKKIPKWKGDKKIYFTDPFILYAVEKNIRGEDGIKVTEELLANRITRGAILENIAANSLAQIGEEPFVKPTDAFLWFFYSQKKEIDFIIKDKDYVAIEIKLGKPTKPVKIEQVKKHIIVGEEIKQEAETVYLPASIFFLLLEKNDKHL